MSKQHLSTDVKIGLALFMFASSLVLMLFPFLTKSPGFGPSFLLFLGAGVSVVILTGIFFIFLNQLNLGFGKTALVLAFGYNSVLALIKLTMSPQGMYLSNQKMVFTAQLTNDPNSPGYMLLVAAIILALYVIAFRSVYGYFVRRLSKSHPELLAPKVKTPVAGRAKGALITVLVIIGILILSGGAIILVPLLLLGPTASYLSYVFAIIGIPLVIALALALFLAYKSFEAVEKQVILTGNAMLLANFLWIGLAMIVLYHVMWVIFMVTLVQLWPFRTYTPK